MIVHIFELQVGLMQSVFQKLGVIIWFALCSCKTTTTSDTISYINITEGTNIAIAVSSDDQFIVVDLQGALYSLSSQGGKGKRLTSYLMDARQPDISTDGSEVAFQSYQDGNWHIWTVDTQGENLNPLTYGTFDHREPDYAPRGTQIIYSSDQSGTYDIWMIDKRTGIHTQITSSDYNDYGPAYHPDGSIIAFVRQKPDSWELNTINLLTLEVSTILRSEQKLYAPSWYPNGTMISFTQHNWLDSQLRTVDMATGIVMMISKEHEDVFPFRAQHIAGASYYTSNGEIQKLIGDQSTNIPFEIALPIRRRAYERKKPNLLDTLSHKIKGIHCPQIAPNGNMVSFVALGDVWIKHLGSQHINRVTDDPYIQLMPTWHPDGSRLVYASDKANVTAIWEYNIISKTSKRLGQISVMPSGISISPDGNLIAYTMAFGPRSGRLSLMNYDTGESYSPRLNFPYSTSAPSWHPNGRHILLSMLQPYSDLYREGIARNVIVDIETGNTSVQSAPSDISFGARTNDPPLIIDHGHRLLYISQGQLHEVGIDSDMSINEEAHRLYPHLADAPSVSADGDKILFLSGTQLKLLNRADSSLTDINVDLQYQSKPSHAELVIHAGTIITMDNQILHDQDIIIKNQLIERIVAHRDRAYQGHYIDASEQYIMPGLIDMHAHQGSDLGTALGYKWLTWGITSTRDPATYPYDAQNRKEAQINGNIVHPRIFYTGSPIDGSRVYYNGTYAQFSIDQVSRELQRSVALEYDLIKTYVRLPDSLQRIVIATAHMNGLPVTSHELYPAALMGIDGVEHIMGTSRRGYTPKMSETYHSYSDVSSIMAAAQMTFTPTIGIYSGYNYMLHQHPKLIQDSRIRNLESNYVISNAKAGIATVQDDPNRYKEMFIRQATLIHDAHQQGVSIIAGTDSPIIPYGFGLFVELLSYQAAGLEPIEVLETATSNASMALNTAHHIGKIKEGMIADLLILNDDPTKDIMNLKSLDQVVLGGKVMKVSELLTQYSSSED